MVNPLSYGEHMMVRRPKLRFLERPVGEVMIILITFTVCFGVLASGATVALLVLVRPSVDVSPYITRVTGLLNTMIGLLAGFLAGRTDREHPKPPSSGEE